MFNQEKLVQQVRSNCDLSDAQHAGVFSVCGLALRLRDLYKWEHRLEPWQERPADQVLEWIGNKEDYWESLPGGHYQRLPLNGERGLDPFDTFGINRILEAHNLFYGAGYAHGLKPSFFLAPIRKKQIVEGHPVITLGSELARDLLTLPAMVQDKAVVLRTESGRHHLWNEMLYVRKSGRPALHFALRQCGCEGSDTKQMRRAMKKLEALQRQLFIRHEVGELEDPVFDRQCWQVIVAAFPHTAIEMLARAVKDLLADTSRAGPLMHIIRHRNAAALAMYRAFQSSFQATLFPQLPPAFERFTEDPDWSAIEAVVQSGRKGAVDLAQRMITIYRQRKPSEEMQDIANQLSALIPCHARTGDR